MRATTSAASGPAVVALMRIDHRHLRPGLMRFRQRILFHGNRSNIIVNFFQPILNASLLTPSGRLFRLSVVFSREKPVSRSSGLHSSRVGGAEVVVASIGSGHAPRLYLRKPSRMFWRAPALICESASLFFAAKRRLGLHCLIVGPWQR